MKERPEAPPYSRLASPEWKRRVGFDSIMSRSELRRSLARERLEQRKRGAVGGTL